MKKIEFSEVGQNNSHVMLLLHGYPDTSLVWKNYVENFKNDFHVINVQIPEHFNSLFEVRMEIHRVLLPFLGKKDIFIMGHDLGCVWASLIADDYQDDLKGLVLIGGMTLNQFKRRTKNIKQLMMSWYMFLFQIPKLPKILTEFFPGELLKIPKMLGQTNFCADKMGLKNWKQYQFFLKEIISLNSRSFIRAKTLVIWGSQDAFLLPPKIDEYRAEFGDVEFLILKGDHWVHLEQVNEVIHFIKTKFGGNYGALKACGEKILQVG